MARRGRFGRSETGASDLSATIASLVRQQKEAEERVFMNAFYDGTEYDGKVPTMTDVIAFYENIASLSGIERGTTDWTALEQKIGAANNFDIKRTYNALITEFNMTDGGNYAEIIDFVTGRAMTSTDQNDLNAYQTGVEDITASFLKYQGEALSRGELTAKEYQRITLNALQVLEPGSKQYTSAIYDAYTYEWNALATIWQNRVKAGKVSASQFESWAKGFAKRVEASGIGKKTELYSSIFATIATYGASSGGGGNNSPAANRLNETISDYSSLLTLASGLTGIDLGKTELADLSDPGATTLNKMINNPEAMLLLADYLDSNPGFNNPTLARLGIQDGDDLRTWLNKSIREGYSDAGVVAASGGTNNLDLWNSVLSTNGNATALDEFAHASTKLAADVKNAKKNPILITYYGEQWKNYLNGVDSIYGKIPTIKRPDGQEYINLGNEAYAALFTAEKESANNGVFSGDTLSGVINDIDINWSEFEDRKSEAGSLVAGTTLLNYDPKTGDYAVVGKPAATATTGSLKQITFVNLGGVLVPFTLTVNGQEVIDDAGEVIGRVYQKPDGETLIVDARSGKIISGVELLEDGDKFKIGAGTPETENFPPLIDTTPLFIPGRDNFTDPSMIREAINLIVENGTSNSLSESEKNELKIQLDQLSTEADLIEASNIEATARPDDIQAKVRVAELRGDQNVIDAYSWFADNADIVSFDQNGKPQLNYAALKEKEQTAQAGGITGAQGVGAQIGAGIGAVLGTPLGPLGMGALGAIGGLLGTALTTENKAMEFQAAILKSRTQEEIERDRAIGARLPTSENYLNRMNQATGGANTFFRNLTTPTPSASPYPIGSLATPRVAAPPSPRAIAPARTQTPIALTPFNAADPEARRAVILGQQATTKPRTSNVNSTTGKTNNMVAR